MTTPCTKTATFLLVVTMTLGLFISGPKSFAAKAVKNNTEKTSELTALDVSKDKGIRDKVTDKTTNQPQAEQELALAKKPNHKQGLGAKVKEKMLLALLPGKELRKVAKEYLHHANMASTDNTAIDGDLKKAILLMLIGLVILLVAAIIGWASGILGVLFWLIGMIVFLVGAVLLIIYLVDNL